jgi:uncharacterized protein
VIPRAGRTAVAGIRSESLLVRLAAAPVDGAANDALVKVLAETFACAPRDVAILSGHTSRTKRIAIAGARVDQIASRLSAILART